MAIFSDDIFKRLGGKIIRNFKGMKKNDSRLVGILGTLIIHLAAAIIFMTFQIRSIKKDNVEIFSVELAEADLEDQPEINEEKLINLPNPSVEKILQGDNEMLNIARNLANKADPTINPDDYIDMVKEELIKSGQLDENNYIDEQKRQRENAGEMLAVQEQKPETVKKDEAEKSSQEIAANYQGPTRIYYDVPGRNHTYLPLPIYMCEGAGKVTLSIEITQKGDVTDADVIPAESTTTDQCLIETAVATALISKFNPDVNAPRLQRGKLTYHFVAQ
ncbi:MAG TPA: hypothetical protein VK213_12645 [Bacteroidales bacterium]|nr:hypothetical protein [Bacteroidales bacterium]